MAGFDFLKATKAGMLQLRSLLNSNDQAWFADLITNGIDNRSGQGNDGKTLDADEIYELACYFRAVTELSKRATKALVRGPSGAKAFRFAYAPGKKENFAFFRFETSLGVLDCLMGVEIPVPAKGGGVEPPEAMDIALERVASMSDLNDQHGELLAFWECKYHLEGNKLSKVEFTQMIGRHSIFGDRRPHSADIFATLGLPEPFCLCAILTNAKEGTYNLDERYKYGFSIAFGYDLQTCSKLEPTRDEHLAYTP